MFRSNKRLWVQLIDDEAARTVASANDRDIAEKGTGRSKTALLLGALIARRARERQIARAVFDRGGYRYHGLVRELARGARENGLEL